MMPNRFGASMFSIPTTFMPAYGCSDEYSSPIRLIPGYFCALPDQRLYGKRLTWWKTDKVFLKWYDLFSGIPATSLCSFQSRSAGKRTCRFRPGSIVYYLLAGIQIRMWRTRWSRSGIELERKDLKFPNLRFEIENGSLRRKEQRPIRAAPQFRPHV
jgi:hypothetical protein